MSTIQKSTNMIIMETKEKLMQVIIQAKLPGCISEMIIREVAENVSLQAKQLLEQDRAIYQQKLLEESQKKAGEKNGNKERTGK